MIWPMQGGGIAIPELNSHILLVRKIKVMNYNQIIKSVINVKCLFTHID